MTGETSIEAHGRPGRSLKWSGIALLLTAAVWAACFVCPRVWPVTGIAEGHKAFLDLDGLLAAGEAAQLGLDPFKPNPIDAWHRPHVYTTWWLVTGKLGWTRADTIWLGPSLVGLVLLSAVWLIRPADRRQVGLTMLVLISPALLMAINRGNNDLVAFVLMCAALALLRRDGGGARLAAVVVLAVAAVLKYYPLVAAVVLLDARTRREFLTWVMAYALVLLVAWPGLVPALASAAKYRPSPEWVYAFGAPMIFRDLAMTAPPAWMLMGGALVVALVAWRRTKPGNTGTPGSRDHEREYACAAAVVIGCFALGSSYAYKLVFSIWLLPWLWRTGVGGAEGRWQRASRWLLLGTLWVDGLLATLVNGVLLPQGWHELSRGVMQAGLVVSQLVAWALIICLLRGLLIYVIPRGAALAGIRKSAIRAA